jgi:hypothetical protein
MLRLRTQFSWNVIMVSLDEWFLTSDIRNHSFITAVSHHRRLEFSIILLGKPQKLKFMVSQ